MPLRIQQLYLTKPKLLALTQLMRLNKPVGIYLVLWPALWSLFLAAGGMPDWQNLVIFVLGAATMRSAGCVINDIADQKFDGHVRRTRERPLVSGKLSPKAAYCLLVALLMLALLLVVMTNILTVLLSFGALALASVYPFMKRHTHLPQVVLGAAFAWSIPMAFAAQTQELPPSLWLVFTATVLWTVVYDTFYAMVDREDDLKIGVKSTAILFGDNDRYITMGLQSMVVVALLMIGDRFELGLTYHVAVMSVITLFAYQQWLIRKREPERCLQAFMNNHWVGMAIFIGVALDTTLR